jgi:hypothetical protein
VRKKHTYIDRARGRFLEGTPFRYPVDAVDAGVKTMAEWCDLLLEERQADSTNLEEVIEA